MRGGVQVQARICPMARRCSYELEKCGGACTGQDGLSAPDAKADKSGLVDHVLLRARKLPLARHDNVSTTLRVRHHIALAPLRMCAVAFPHTAGNWVMESSERDAGPCTTIVCLYLRLRDVQGLDSFGPISGTAAINITCKNATNHAVSKKLIHL